MRKVSLAAVDAVSTLGKGSSIEVLETYCIAQRCTRMNE